MLNYTKKYINFFAFGITILILIVLIILDIISFSKTTNKKEKNITNQAYENSIDIQSAYVELSKIVIENSSTTNEKQQVEKKEEEIVSTEVQKVKKKQEETAGAEVQKVKKEQEETASAEVQKVKKEQKETVTTKTQKVKKEQEKNEDREIVGNIDIYSTNVWRIKIPKLNLDAPITEGTSQEALRRTIGHFEQTDKWEGNVALAGHNRGYRCNFFQEIKTLKKGDKIIYSTEKGSREYKVVVNEVIKETDWTYIKDTEDNRITLITCEAGKKEYRRCIQAIET